MVIVGSCLNFEDEGHFYVPFDDSPNELDSVSMMSHLNLSIYSL